MCMCIGTHVCVYASMCVRTNMYIDARVWVFWTQLSIAMDIKYQTKL